MSETMLAGARSVEAAMSSGQRLGPTNPFDRFTQGDVDRGIPAVFEERLLLRGDRIAVETDDRALSFAEVNGSANRLAHAILDQSGDASEPVCLLTREQSAEVIIGVLGILKAGKIYVPVDAAFAGTERVTQIFVDSGATLVVADDTSLEAARKLAGSKGRVININDLPTGLSSKNPGLDLRPERPAVLLYTSGSTGSPKGVCHSHRNLLHINRVYINDHHLVVDDRMLLLSSAGVLGGVRTILGSLLSGAVIVPYNAREKGLGKLAPFVIANRLTGLQMTPTTYRRFMASLKGDERFEAMRIVRLGGEPLFKRDLELFAAAFEENVLLINGMGATEALTFFRYFANRHTELRSGSVPVGKPPEQVKVRLEDDNGREVAPGDPGEIVLRSEYMALGYWRQPELTGQVFSKCPENPSCQIYRSGDLGVMLPDGCVQHLGREDFQVKIRGFRIELGEVEQAIADCPTVKSTAVVGRMDESNERLLAAYIVPRAGHEINAIELRRFLTPKLPSHMIPSVFVELEQMPLTASGKVDRKALPDPPAPTVEARSQDETEAPQGEIETALAVIWKKILRLTAIGRRENFFDLGGDSLRAASFCDEIEREFGWTLLPAELAASPTIAQLARLIQEGAGMNERLVPLQAGGSRPPLYLIPQAGGDGVIYRELPALLGADQPVYTLRPPGLSGPSDFRETIPELAMVYAKAIQEFQPTGALHLGGLSLGGVVAWEVACELQERGREIAFLGLFDSYGPGCRTSQLAEEGNALKRAGRRMYRLAQKARLHGAIITRLEGAAKWTYLKDRVMNRWKALAGEFEGGQRRPNEDLFRKIFDRDMAASRVFLPRMFDGDATLFRCRIHFYREQANSRELGWKDSCSGRLRIVDLPGYHSLMFTEPFAEYAGVELRKCLEECRGGSDKSDSV